nr:MULTISPECIES: hypothetical protein [unclassified Wenzhouxiangella]
MLAGLLVGLLAGSARLGVLLIGIQVALKCADPARGSNCLFLQEFELFGFDLTRIQCGVQVGLHLGTRSACDTEEMSEFIGILSLEALGDVGHHRNRRSLELIPQSEISAQSGVPTAAIDVLYQHPSLLPGLDILEPRNRPHTKSLQPISPSV